MAKIALHLLGSPRIERDGEAVHVDTRKATALVAYLAATGQRHTRDALATLRWPDADQASARAALRRTLSALKKAMAGDALKVDRETIALEPAADDWVDVVRFESCAGEVLGHAHSRAEICDECIQPLTEAAGLYRSDFLAGFTLRDSAAFDDWQFSQTEGFRRRLSGVLERLVQCHVAQSDLSSALLYAQRLLDLDPLNEAAHRQLMMLYSWTGRRSSALGQYRQCLRVLDRELGVPPLEETTELYQAIREDRAPEAPVFDPSPPIAVAPVQSGGGQSIASRRPQTSGYPLIGRSTEWKNLVETHAAIGDDGHLLVLEGEAGIGKTRLAEEFLDYVKGKGGATVAAKCYQGETDLAFGPFAESMREAIRRTPDLEARLNKVPEYCRTEVSRLLPELGEAISKMPGIMPLDSPGAQSRFFESMTQMLMALCAGPIAGIALFDDLHWADEASVDLLTYIVRRLRGRPVLIVATWRTEDVGADDRLRRLVSEAERAGLATRLSLSRLSAGEVAELVFAASNDGSRLPEGLPPGLQGRLHKETDGLPFFLVEYLATFTDGDTRVKDEWSMPARVRDLLLPRLSGVGETGRQLIDTAAVIGRSFDFDTLLGASGRGEDESVDALDELILKRLIREVGIEEGSQRLLYDFGHEQLRTVAYEETSLVRRRLLHRRVAESIVRHPRYRRQDGALAAVTAEHYLLSGQDNIAASHFKLAGDHARSLHANSEALTHYRSAITLAWADEAQLHEAIGDLETLTGDYGAAIASYEKGAAASEPGYLPLIEHKLGNVYLRLGDWKAAESYFSAAVVALGQEGSAAQRSRVYADWSLTAERKGDAEYALELAKKALELGEVANDTGALAQGHNILGMLSRHQCDLDAAGRHLGQSLALAETLSDPSARVAALNNLALTLRETGELEKAISLTETALDLCSSRGDRHREAALHNNLADLFHAVGRSESAMSHLKLAVTIFAELGLEEDSMLPEIWKLVEWCDSGAKLDPLGPRRGAPTFRVYGAAWPGLKLHQ